jgi:uroporphyrinogen-III decarboxylase
MAFSDWLYANTDATHRIALERLVTMVSRYLQTQGMDKADADALLASDYSGGAKPKPAETPASDGAVWPPDRASA